MLVPGSEPLRAVMGMCALDLGFWWARHCVQFREPPEPLKPQGTPPNNRNSRHTQSPSFDEAFGIRLGGPFLFCGGSALSLYGSSCSRRRTGDKEFSDVSGHLRRSGECLRERGPVGAGSAVAWMMWSGNSPGLHGLSPVFPKIGSLGFRAIWVRPTLFIL